MRKHIDKYWNQQFPKRLETTNGWVVDVKKAILYVLSMREKVHDADVHPAMIEPPRHLQIIGDAAKTFRGSSMVNIAFRELHEDAGHVTQSVHSLKTL